MVLVKLLTLLLISSCAKVNYLTEQTIGQVRLQSRAKSNDEVLKSPLTPSAHKEKIRLVQKYKKYFYKYFKRKPTDIYEKMTKLEGKAVSHLVIAAPYDELKAKKHCFPIMGCFPYLGFFHESSADEYIKELNEQNLYTYKRPVYAYSTLGYFTDTILSSFFYYDEFELAELIFHELFHTIFFVKNEVDLNENLANYFGQKMALEYFKDRAEILNKQKIKYENRKKISEKIVILSNRYKKRLELQRPSTKKDADKMLDEFLILELGPELSALCKKLNMKTCKAATRKWNNASLSAYLTYEDKMIPLENLHKKRGSSLVEYFLYIESLYKEYGGDKFEERLLSQL